MEADPPAPPPLPEQELQQEAVQIPYLQRAQHVAEHPQVLPDAGRVAAVPNPDLAPPDAAMNMAGLPGAAGVIQDGDAQPHQNLRGQRNPRRVKIPQPRILGESETQQKLDHWKATFLLYYSTDEVFQLFLDPDTRWFPDRANYGFQQETDGLERSPARLRSDLLAFFQLVAAHLPNYYISSKLKFTTCPGDVWKLIYRLYGAETTCDSFLNLPGMKKLPQESYRGFFERLTGHVMDHMVGPMVVIDELSSGPLGDKMNISMMNLVTLLWLNQINSRLPKIVQTEYQRELREGTQIYALVNRLQDNIPNLLARHDSEPGVNSVQVSQVVEPEPQVPASVAPSEPDYFDYGEDLGSMDENCDGYVRFLRRSGRGSSRGGGFRGGSSAPARGGFGGFRGKRFSPKPRVPRASQPFCGHCAFLKRVTQRPLDINHDPDSCRNKNYAVRMLQVAQETEDGLDGWDEHSVEDTGPFDQGEFLSSSLFRLYPDYSQIETGGEDSVPTRYSRAVAAYQDFSSGRSNFIKPRCHSPKPVSTEKNENKYSHIRKVISDHAQKAKSPSLTGKCQGQELKVIFDTGAELNVLDWDTARRLRLQITESSTSASAANQTALKVVGQTVSDMIVSLRMEQGWTDINLGKVTVIKDLGTELLVGEPGLGANDLFSMAAHKTVFAVRPGNRLMSAPYDKDSPGPPSCEPGRAAVRTVLRPNKSVSVRLRQPVSSPSSQVRLTPRAGSLSWAEPQVAFNNQLIFSVKNCSKRSIHIKKNQYLVDVCGSRSTSFKELLQRQDQLRDLCARVKETPAPQFHPNIARLVDSGKILPTVDEPIFPTPSNLPPDPVQFTPLVDIEDDHDLHIKSIQIDPDNQLTPDQRLRFQRLHEKYKTIFTPRPGKYNGNCGIVDNSLAFSSPPTLNGRIHVPNYSPEMNEILAQKMDELMEWGVLMEPERVGVRVRFCSPSMVVAKHDGGKGPAGYRLVTDFSQLNENLIKSPAISPSINDARRAMAQAKYRVDLDLSNYFYQSGMSRQDMQYLGTHHPTRGMLVYTCQPQGIKSASEDSYEKLARIFGQDIRAGRMTRMADGLHVLGDTVDELLVNYERCLSLLQYCGLTIKPSKVEICPKKSVLFGWKLEDGFWAPTNHTTSALASFQRPKTVNQLRSFIGSFKQISACVEGYAQILTDLDKCVGNRGSREEITWTPELSNAFERAKAAARDPKAIVYPRRTDQLHTYSDFSAAHRAVGGRLMIERTKEDGSKETFLGGFFSVMLDAYKEKWTPCEGESLGIKLVLDHYAPLIRENKNRTIHHTDSKVCVQAWNRLQKGAFSTSARVASFLTGLSCLTVDVVHIPGKELNTSDFASRHPRQCDNPDICQLCRFALKLQKIGDKASNIYYLEVDETLRGNSMPFTSRRQWVNIQHQDPMLCAFRQLYNTGQSPPAKKTKGEHTRLKQLHTMHTRGLVTIHEDGLITVRCKDGFFSGGAVVVPSQLFMGIIQAVHIRLDHPSKTQMAHQVQRYFYTSGWNSMISDLVDRCHRCASLKSLPKVLTASRPSDVQGFACNWAADIVERCGQKILVVRENLSSWTSLTLLPNQTTEAIRPALLGALLDAIPDNGCVVRTDGAASFQSLAREADTPGSIYHKYGIKIEVGDPLNPNRNPVAENSIKEFHKEVLKLHGDNKTLSWTDLLQVERNINSRIRGIGHAPREILLRRDMQSNSDKDIREGDLQRYRVAARTDSVADHLQTDLKTSKFSEDQRFFPSDIVFLRKDGDKLKGRESYIILSQDGEKFRIKKVQHQLRATTYTVPPEAMILSPLSQQTRESGLSEASPSQAPPVTITETATQKEAASSKPTATAPEKEAAVNGQTSTGTQGPPSSQPDPGPGPDQIPAKPRGRPRTDQTQPQKLSKPQMRKQRKQRVALKMSSEQYIQNLAGRPRRQAALQAHQNWTVSRISIPTTRPGLINKPRPGRHPTDTDHPPPPKPRYLIPEDQSDSEDEDFQDFVILHHAPPARRAEERQPALHVPQPPAEADLTASETESTASQDLHSQAESLQWDHSPESIGWLLSEEDEAFMQALLPRNLFSDQEDLILENDEPDNVVPAVLDNSNENSYNIFQFPQPLRKPRIRKKAASSDYLERSTAFRKSKNSSRRIRDKYKHFVSTNEDKSSDEDQYVDMNRREAPQWAGSSEEQNYPQPQTLPAQENLQYQDQDGLSEYLQNINILQRHDLGAASAPEAASTQPGQFLPQQNAATAPGHLQMPADFDSYAATSEAPHSSLFQHQPEGSLQHRPDLHLLQGNSLLQVVNLEQLAPIPTNLSSVSVVTNSLETMRATRSSNQTQRLDYQRFHATGQKRFF